jgi:GNAT superfamily N-acetyltransferase
MAEMEIVANINDPRLVDAMEENYAYAMSGFAHGTGGESYHGTNMTRYISGLPVHFFNGVTSARLDQSRLDAMIEAALAPFQSRNLPMAWLVGPGTRPEDLGQRLEAHGLTRADDTPCMAIDIRALAPPQLLPGVTFVPVTAEEQVPWFAHAAAVGFGFDSEAEPIFQTLTARACLPPDPRWAYHLALLEGAPVATCLTFLHSGVAGLFTISTIPEARGHGIGGEITRHALLNAGSLGYRVAVLQASPMGFPVYQRLGFATCATFIEYEWTPPNWQGA